MSGIKDRDAKNALREIVDHLETFENEFINLEETVKEKEEEISELEQKHNKLQERIDELEEQVKDLEEALAEAYLTDEVNDGIPGKDVELSSGCGTDVPDPTGDKAVD